jgi:ATP-dependent Clp protease ATP-binding subunit ClpA
MGLTSCRRITIATTLARRRRECAIGHHADCRVAAERYTLICDGPDYVGTEHLLLSLYRDPHGLAAVILVESGLGEDQATAAIAQRVKRGGGARAGKLPFTRKATGVLDAARSAAAGLGHGHVGTKHLLIGLDRVDGVAKEVLERSGLTPELVDQQVVGKLAPCEQRRAQSTDRTARDEEKGVE